MIAIEGAYPSVWRRICAYLVDYGLLFGVLIALQLLLYRVGRGFPYSLLQTGMQIELWVWSSISLPAWLYFALSESSPRQATFGKRLLGLRVTTLQGNRIGLGRALLRTVIKLLPWELTHLSLMLPVPLWWDPQPTLRPGIVGVYALMGVYLVTLLLNPRRQSVHDLVARTVVVSEGKKAEIA